MQSMTYEVSFNPRAAVPDFGKYQLARAALNEAAKSVLAEADVAYGPHARHRLDVYRPERTPSGDLHLYFHGGYWRAGDKSNFGFLAKALVDRGIAVVVPNYTLCGPSTFESVLESARAAFAWVVANANRQACSPFRISLSGHSAGAYLCAHLLQFGLPPLVDGHEILGATLVSGVYTPGVAIGTTVNAELAFERPQVDAFDLAQLPWMRPTQANVFAGAAEPPAWIALSRDYADMLRAAGSADGRFQLLPGHDHFSILDEYRAGGRIHEAIVAQHGSASSSNRND